MLDNDSNAELETIVNNAIDRILLMKVLPRIEGDSDVFNLKTAQIVGDVKCTNRLQWLRELAPTINANENENANHQQTAKEKIEEMIERLNNQEFTRFGHKNIRFRLLCRHRRYTLLMLKATMR